MTESLTAIGAGAHLEKSAVRVPNRRGARTACRLAGDTEPDDLLPERGGRRSGLIARLAARAVGPTIDGPESSAGSATRAGWSNSRSGLVEMTGSERSGSARSSRRTRTGRETRRGSDTADAAATSTTRRLPRPRARLPFIDPHPPYHLSPRLVHESKKRKCRVYHEHSRATLICLLTRSRFQSRRIVADTVSVELVARKGSSRLLRMEVEIAPAGKRISQRVDLQRASVMVGGSARTSDLLHVKRTVGTPFRAFNPFLRGNTGMATRGSRHSRAHSQPEP